MGWFLGAMPSAPANICNGMLIHICRWIKALSRRRRKFGRLAELNYDSKMKYCSKPIEKKNKKCDSLSLNYFRLHNLLNIINWVDFRDRKILI